MYTHGSALEFEILMSLDLNREFVDLNREFVEIDFDEKAK